MESLQTALFEDPTGIYISLAIVAAVGLVGYKSWGTFKSLCPTLMALSAGGMVFAISTLVVTDREKILAASDAIALAINSNDMAGLELFLDEQFIGPPVCETRTQAMQLIARTIKEHKITSVKFNVLELNPRDDLASMLLGTDIASDNFPLVRLHWRIVWAKRSIGWRIYKVIGPIAKPDTEENEAEQQEDYLCIQPTASVRPERI
jgi:hypothetical protein